MENKENSKIEVYTDGSCLGNPGVGGFGAVILLDQEKIELSGAEKETTNNRMEMRALICAMEFLLEEGVADRETHFYTDSNLIVQTLNQGWKRKANIDLWAEIDKLRAWKNYHFHWVKGHHTNKFNILADKLAVTASKKLQNEL